MADETLDTAAPQGQPAGEQAGQPSETPRTDPGISDDGAAPTQAGQPDPASPLAPGRKYAGKYDSPDELERAYLSSQSEASRMAADLARAQGREEGRSTTATPDNPAAKYSTDQLESYKQAHLLALADAQVNGKGKEASDAAASITIIDKELRRRDVQGLTAQFDRRTAHSELLNEVGPVIAQYKDELQPGRPLYDKAHALYQKAVRAGAPEGEITSTSCILLAAQMSGQNSKGVGTQARQDLTANINKSFREAVVAGAGKASTGVPTGPNFEAMSDKDFIAYKVSQGYD